MKTLVILAWLAGASSAFAQGAIAGLVRDPADTPLSGVTVEASGPALLEKTRTTTTDRAGRYRLEDLPPGIYKVRFTVAGLSPSERAGIEIAGSFTATVDAMLEVGSLRETVTVTGEVPAVDTHTATREVTLTGEVVGSIPTARSYNALLVLIPGVVTNVNDTITATATASFPIHGGRTNEGRLSLDGLTIGSPPSGNSATSYVIDTGNVQEVTFRTAGSLADVETSGLVMNIVPRSGGNTVHGSFFASGTGGGLQSDNLTDSLKKQGAAAATPLRKVYDISGTAGGPIRRDRLWYFVGGHVGGSTKDSPNVFYNLNAGNPAAWVYAPDFTRREYSDRTLDRKSVV